MIISIDGFSATGKSTIAFLLAERLKLKYLNSGSIYRCIALKIMNKEFNVNDSDIYEKIVNMNIDFKIENNNQRVYLDNIDVTDDIRKEEVSVFTPTFANNPVIKSAIREIQKKIVNEGNVVIEGRDIGTRIAPNAEYKFYLYCSLDERARRVYNERIKKEREMREANSKGTMLLLRVKLIEYHEKYMKRGSIPTYAYDNFNEMYDAYHALGGNGMVTKMKNEIELLHLQSKEGS